jgi:hypothetical protein
MSVMRALEEEIALVAVNTAHASASAVDPTQRATYEVARKREMCFQCGLLRCILANPFRGPPSIDLICLAWNGGTVKRLAQAAYEERSFPHGTLDLGRLAVLADALEEAGCTDEEILGHLRGPGPHIRGCWVLDLILGKS